MSKLAFLVTGAAGGLLVGYMTRPTVMGVNIPVEVLFSGHPSDAAFRSELASHLVMAVGLGIVAGWIVHAVIRGNGMRGRMSEVDNAQVRWQALIDVDPEIAKAAETARQRDQQCEALFASKYLALADKTYLEAALKHALDDFDAREQKRQDVAAVTIRWVNTRNVHGIDFKRGVAVSKHGESQFLLQGGVWTIDNGYKCGSRFASEEEMREALA